MKFKSLLILLLVCSYTSAVKAQNGHSSSSSTVNYTNDRQLLQQYQEDAKALADEGVLLKPELAQEQLDRAMNRMIRIEAKPHQDKQLKGSEIYKQARKSMVRFGSAYKHPHKDGMGFHLNSASGYIIDSSGLVVTNHHVVQGYTNGSGNHSESGGAAPEFVGMYIYTNDGKTYQIKEILSASAVNDLAIVQVETNGDELNAIPIGDSPPVGSTVYALTNPNKLYGFFTKGMVSRYVERPNAGEHHGNALQKEMSITADYGVGSSGGPIIDQYGNVVGTVSSTSNVYAHPDNKTGMQIVIKHTVPVDALKELVRF